MKPAPRPPRSDAYWMRPEYLARLRAALAPALQVELDALLERHAAQLEMTAVHCATGTGVSSLFAPARDLVAAACTARLALHADAARPFTPDTMTRLRAPRVRLGVGIGDEPRPHRIVLYADELQPADAPLPNRAADLRPFASYAELVLLAASDPRAAALGADARGALAAVFLDQPTGDPWRDDGRVGASRGEWRDAGVFVCLARAERARGTVRMLRSAGFAPQDRGAYSGWLRLGW